MKSEQTTQAATPDPVALTPGTPRMTAMVQDQYGGPEVLRLEEINRPQIGDEECCCACTRSVWTAVPGI
jgi:hypothetical protein